jgi:nucleoside-diphosphate-sugar epimerase
MHILFIGYGKTSERVAQQLFTQHQISSMSLSAKNTAFSMHYAQDVHALDLTQLAPIDMAYVLLSPKQSTIESYQHTYLDSVAPIVKALKSHPIQRVIVVSSTRVYGENCGERLDDESEIIPSDAQGALLHAMEQHWQAAYPNECVIIRPTGIYGTSVARMVKLAQNTLSYPHIHYSNRIHIDDLATFLANMLHVKHPKKSYIVTNNQPLALHKIIAWFQQQLGLPELVVEHDHLSGKRIYATYLQQMGFHLQHENCWDDYLNLLQKNPTSGGVS